MTAEKRNDYGETPDTIYKKIKVKEKGMGAGTAIIYGWVEVLETKRVLTHGMNKYEISEAREIITSLKIRYNQKGSRLSEKEFGSKDDKSIWIKCHIDTAFIDPMKFLKFSGDLMFGFIPKWKDVPNKEDYFTNNPEYNWAKSNRLYLIRDSHWNKQKNDFESGVELFTDTEGTIHIDTYSWQTETTKEKYHEEGKEMIRKEKLASEIVEKKV